MQRVLILFAHPTYQNSAANRALVEAVARLEGVTFHDLYERYPDLLIHVLEEQRLLREHDIIVFQHPFYWYSSPAILKEWQDHVLEYGFAFGEGGTALRGKRWLSALTAGGEAAAYQRGGVNHFTIRELLAPFEQTARLCGMEFLEPFVVHDANDLSAAALREKADAYRARIVALRDGEAGR